MKTMVSTLEFLGPRSIRACVSAAESVEGFTRWCSKILRTVAHIDAKDDQFILFRCAIQTIYRLAQSLAAGAVRGDSDSVSRSTRPASSVFHDRLKRAISIRQSYVRKHARAGNRPDASSPRVKLSLSQSSTPSSRASQQESGLLPSTKVLRSALTLLLRREAITILVRMFFHRPTTVVSPLRHRPNSPRWVRVNKLST